VTGSGYASIIETDFPNVGLGGNRTVTRITAMDEKTRKTGQPPTRPSTTIEAPQRENNNIIVKRMTKRSLDITAICKLPELCIP